MKHKSLFVSLLISAAALHGTCPCPISANQKIKPAARLLAPAACTGTSTTLGSIAVYSLEEQESSTPVLGEYNGVDAVNFEKSPEYAQNFYLSSDKKSIIINAATGGLFSCTYTVNAKTNTPFVAYLQAVNAVYFPGPNGFIINGSLISVPDTQSPGPLTLTVTFQLPPGETILRLMFNGAIAPQNSTSGYFSNITKDYKCISASLTLTQLY
jgi:hypothetical protein